MHGRNRTLLEGRRYCGFRKVPKGLQGYLGHGPAWDSAEERTQKGSSVKDQHCLAMQPQRPQRPCHTEGCQA